MKKILLNIYYWPSFIVITLLWMVIIPFVMVISLVLIPHRIGRTIRRAIVVYGWILVRFIPFFAPVKVVYRTQKLPKPVIFVANHNSAIDPYLFGALAVENSFVTSWPFKIPLYNICMHIAGYVNVDKGWENMREKCMALLADNSNISIWPEGHRSRNGKLGRFKKGVFVLAVETKVPLVPVCILGSAKVLPPGHRLLRPGEIELFVLDPVYPGEGKDTKEEADLLRVRVRTIIEKTLRENGHFHRCSSV